MSRLLLLGAALILTMVAGRSADAAVIRYDISSTCDSNCGLIGLNPGDPVGGFFVLDTLAQTPGDEFRSSTGSSDPVELLEFSMTFGNISIDSSSAGGSLVFGSFGASLNVLDRFAFFASEALSLDTGEGFGIHGGPTPFTGLRVATDSRCTDPDCRFFVSSTSATLAAFNAPVTGVPVQLPLPATAAILLGSLGLLGLMSVSPLANARRGRSA